MNEAAMSLGSEAATNAELRSSAKRTGCADAIRESCLTERTQCQGGLRAWKHDLYDQGEDRPSDAGKVTLAGQGNVVARAGGTARARAGSTARAELDRSIVRVLAVHNDGAVLRYRAWLRQCVSCR